MPCFLPQRMRDSAPVGVRAASRRRGLGASLGGRRAGAGAAWRRRRAARRHELVGVFMRNWDEAEEAGAPGGCGEADLGAARAVAAQLRIPLHEADFTAQYWHDVFTDFVAQVPPGAYHRVAPTLSLSARGGARAPPCTLPGLLRTAAMLGPGGAAPAPLCKQHRCARRRDCTAAALCAPEPCRTSAGRCPHPPMSEVARADAACARAAQAGRGLTPNPDLACNRHIKFGALAAWAAARGADTLATGHYARLRPCPQGGPPQLLRGLDAAKDQSYFLASVPGAALARAAFPLGGLTKAAVRRLAADARLAPAGRRSSAGICFIGARARRGAALDRSERRPSAGICFIGARARRGVARDG